MTERELILKWVGRCAISLEGIQEVEQLRAKLRATPADQTLRVTSTCDHCGTAGYIDVTIALPKGDGND